MAFLYAEDEALKAKLQGLTVSDVNNTTRAVPVWFRYPEVEARNITYPCIIIERLGYERDSEREHRGYIQLGYSPDGFPNLADPTNLTTNLYTDFPIPYLINYAVVVMARNILHDLQVNTALTAVNKLPARFGYLEIPEDGTIRRLDLVGGPDNMDAIENNKRIFRKSYSIHVSTELTMAQIDEIVRVGTVHIDLEDIY